MHPRKTMETRKCSHLWYHFHPATATEDILILTISTINSNPCLQKLHMETP